MNKTSIVFTGDIGFDRHMDKKWEDEQLFSQEVLDFFHSADHACLNVEGAVVDMPNDGSLGQFVHSMSTQVVKPFRKLRADIWSIGNNHTMDAGAEGVASTRAVALSEGCKVFGGGSNIEEASAPIYLEEAGGIGIIGLSYMNGCRPATETEAGIFPWNDMELIQKRIDEIKAKCRWCVLCVHGGEEFVAMPLPYVRDRYMKFLEMGADVVVGHHPHVPENYEVFDDGKMIFYSLGNFIFDTNYQRAHLYTDTGVLLKLIFTEESVDFEAIGTKIDRTCERIGAGSLPDIFTNIPAEEYALLSPLNVKAFFEDDLKMQLHLHPEYADRPEGWVRYRKSMEYCKDTHMDYDYLRPIADKAEDGTWQQSKLEKVKAYLQKLL